MAENVDEILSKRIKLPKKQALAPLRKKIIKPGEFPYDLSQRKRSKCAYCTYTCYNNMIYWVQLLLFFLSTATTH